MHLDEEEKEVFRLLDQLDAGISRSRVTVEDIKARARARSFPWMRIAAAVVLSAVVVGAAYAAPGSPVKEWVASMIERVSGGGPTRTPAPPLPAQTTVADTSVAGIAVDPGSRLVILFTTRQSTGFARVSLVQSREVVVRSRAGSAAFTSDLGRIVVDNRGEESFDVLIPLDAPHVEIRVAARRVFLKRDGLIEAGVSADESGVRAIPLTTPAS